ncbi:hypothetical protein SAMN05444339_102417 [Loktanella atrilutea]|uniref:DUF1989 domain-containing protein n=1 Tax=Loktanella atrilutea TaxID=366533 RepID=A0A1M4XB00_LOKAT|nr:DUF1989 domain-containing protein [Loktanella atrilutea]SHE90709.1 hypothetical protein SAMN05444339_102417 [Loktanella atrilutea]
MITPQPPSDADRRRAVAPVICYPTDTLPVPNPATFDRARAATKRVAYITVPPRNAAAIRVAAGQVLRIHCPDGPQVGDLNLFNAHDLSEKFYSGKTRALHGTHVTTGHRLWSCFPYLRPMATITGDTLAWYGRDGFGAGVHDVIGTRCDPYTARLLGGGDYHHCCHSNLTRALSTAAGLPLTEAEPLVHDVLNVFMCTGFTADTGQYFMKASPVRAGDHLDLLAEIDLLAVLSACPGGDCSAEHSSDTATCHPLAMEVLDAERAAPWPEPPLNAYDRSHGVQANAASSAISTMSPKDRSR